MREVRCNMSFFPGEINGEEGSVVDLFITEASELGRGIDTTGY